MVIITALLMRFANLERLKRSAVGRYISKNMTAPMQMLRISGNFVMLIGAWYHLLWLIIIGLVMILLGWLRGFIVPRKSVALP
jgi:hypothetical protein